MVKYILRLGEDITLSILNNSQLIYHLKVGNLADLPEYIKGIDIDSLTVLVQGTVSKTLTDNSYRLSSFTKNNVITHFIMPERDLVFLTELCNSSGIKELYILSYLDFVCKKFLSESKVIVVDNYLDKYIVMYLEYGEIKELYRTPLNRLSQSISQLKSEFNAPVYNCKEKVNSMELVSTLSNLERFEKNYLFSIDHIPYCLNTKSKSLIKNSDITSLREMWGVHQPEEDDIDRIEKEFRNQIPNAVKKQEKAIYSNKRSAQVVGTSETIVVEKTDILVNSVIIFILFLFFFGLYFNVLFAGKIQLLSENNNLLKARSQETSNVSSDSQNAPSDIKQVYLTTQKANINNVSFDNGEVSVIALSDNGQTKESNKSIISQNYSIEDSANLGNYSKDGKTYEKTKYIINVP